MTNYYNEFDRGAAAWLRELIDQGIIPKGVVDERSIEDVTPSDLNGFTQCHFFAGIGGWSYALRLAGWPDDLPVWTGSCPCQPFSPAGKGKGFADERHLWPAFFHLIEQCTPAIVFGEQVADRHGLDWLDLVQTDMEGAGYAFAAADLCAAGLGAPHWRQRLYFVGMADAECRAAERHGQEVDAAPGGMQGAAREQRLWADARDGNTTRWMADADHTGPQGRGERRDRASERAPWAGGVAGGLELTEGSGWIEEHPILRGVNEGNLSEAWPAGFTNGRAPHLGLGVSDPLHGSWAGADWIGCTDGKLRPVEPAHERMAHGVSIAMDDCLHEVAIDAEACKRITAEAVRAMRDGHDPQAIWGSVGGRVGFPAASVLLAIVLKHSGALGGVSDGGAQGSAPRQVWRCLQQMWHDNRPDACAPQGREFSEQLSRELGSALPKLSQKSSPEWRMLMMLNASPLADKIPGRVGLLRGYGNAIVPQVAAGFIKAVM